MKNLLKIIIGLFLVFPINLRAESLSDLAKDLSSQIKSTQTIRMAVLSFPYIDGFDSTGSKIVQERLITALSQNKKFSVLERVLLHKVLEQAKLEMSGLFDETTTIKLGKMLGVEAVLTGTLIDINDKATEINARIINTETGKIIASAKADILRIWKDKIKGPMPIFNPIPLPKIEEVETPKSYLKIETKYDDIETLEKYDEVVKFDKSSAFPLEKVGKWKEFSTTYPKYKKISLKRAKEWEAYDKEFKNAEKLKEQKLEALKKDYQTLRRYLALTIISPKQKADWAEKFMENYGYNSDNVYKNEISRYLLQPCVNNNKIGFCYYDGSTAIKGKYEFANLFGDGLAPVKIDGKYGFVDNQGNEIIPLKYDYASSFRKGLAPVGINSKYGFIDRRGNEIIPLKYDTVSIFNEGLAPVKFNDKWGVIDIHGKTIISFKYDDARSFNEGFAVVKLDGKWGFIDKKGNEIIPLKYDYAWVFSEGLALVALNGKYGCIDRQGSEIIPLKYDSAFPFLMFDGLAHFRLNGKWILIDRWGREYFPD